MSRDGTDDGAAGLRDDATMSTAHPVSRAAAEPLLAAARSARWVALRSPRVFKASLAAPSANLERVGAVAAWQAATAARRSVPAYADFLARSGWRDNPRLT